MPSVVQGDQISLFLHFQEVHVQLQYEFLRNALDRPAYTVFFVSELKMNKYFLDTYFC